MTYSNLIMGIILENWMEHNEKNSRKEFRFTSRKWNKEEKTITKLIDEWEWKSKSAEKAFF